MKVLYILFVVVSLFCFVAEGIGGESGTVIKADQIRAEPFRDAKVVGSLTAGEKVDIVKREGGWVLISGAKKGWVKMLNIRRGDNQASKGIKPSGIIDLASGRAGSGQVVSTSGIRGLNEEELKSARFNEAEMALLGSFRTSKAEAVKFASEGGLKSKRVKYLSE